MKARRSVLMVLALTGAFTFFSATSVMAQLFFSSMQGTWWVTAKSQEKGYVYTLPPADGSIGKAIKFQRKWKPGYIYFPDDSLNGFIFENVIGVFFDSNGDVKVGRDKQAEIKGGTPNDFVLVEEDSGEGDSSISVFQIKLIEDKKEPGNIKSGKIRTLAGSFYYPLNDNMMFAGKNGMKLKLIPEDKVPDHIKQLAFSE
jgi:hypothetical protein